ncbi:hypothetical protein [Synechococcus sp. BDU 130192]|uniref:hypothetical protein n=1 Tax=Synechococcus sp. BDU 130192 TaxID=2042059 RepID=UPI0011806F8C|nr:hypothetical protein [Synechococcus sp. BDU 130192]
MLKKILYASLIVVISLPVFAKPSQASSCQLFDNGYSLFTNCEFPTNRGGVFRNGEWQVSIARWNQGEAFDYMYKGENLRTGDSLSLNNVDLSGTTTRSKYIFRNGNYRYIVTVRPSDPNTIRLEVYQGGQVLLNQLLYRVGSVDDAYREFYGPSYGR